MQQHWRIWCLIGLVIILAGQDGRTQSPPEGQLTIAFDTSIAPTFLDPAETPGIAIPFVFLYALHDALSKPLPGNDVAPCLAESWTESSDGLVYEFTFQIGAQDVMNAHTLPQVKMPNRDNFMVVYPTKPK